MSRTHATVATQIWSTTSIQSFGASIAARVTATMSRWQAWRACRRDIARLEAMDERMLRDIGLTRSEIGRAVHFGRYGE
jgi:uncharacterized protein YjiS (DUF1127 family)